MQQQRKDEIMQRFERSEQLLQQNREESKHVAMLKQEHRRLKEQDIKKLRERTTRQAIKKKMAIIENI